MDLGVIWPELFKFRILNHVRPPVDHEATPPTQNGHKEKIELLGTNLTLGWFDPSIPNLESSTTSDHPLTMNTPHPRKKVKIKK